VPPLDACVACGAGTLSGRRAGFSSRAGGTLCEACTRAGPEVSRVDPRLLALMQNIQRLPREGAIVRRLPRLSRAQSDPILEMLLDHVQHQTGKPTRMRRWLAA
jgi:recombinational DNA repair protein (RecF pathway)